MIFPMFDPEQFPCVAVYFILSVYNSLWQNY